MRERLGYFPKYQSIHHKKLEMDCKAGLVTIEEAEQLLKDLK